MNAMLSLAALAGLQLPVAAHAQPGAPAPACATGVTAPGPACGRPTAVAAVNQTVAAPAQTVRDIPLECSSCPAVASCYPA